MKLLQTQGLTLHRGDRCLLRDLNLTVESGQRWALLGRNGSGKSTLLKTLVGLNSTYQGEIWIGQDRLPTLASRERAQAIGLVFQHSHVGFHNTALEMALSGNYAHPGQTWWHQPQQIENARQALRDVDLDEQQQRPLASLSGGELRRCEIARLLVQNPALALLDEPLNHLDIGQQISILRLLQRHFGQSEKSLLLALHDINLSRHFASHLLLLFGDGRWLAGPVDQLATPNLLGELLEHPLQHIGTRDNDWLVPEL